MRDQHDQRLRPQDLDEFAGQDDLRRHLRIMLSAAKERGDVCDHILLSGPPGCGKTTLATIIARELGLPLVASSGPALARPGDLAKILVGLATPSVVFIDEIHRLEQVTEELLYPAMEDGILDVVVDDGPRTRSRQIPLQPFVLVGATTQVGMLSAPFRDRFGYHGHLDLYPVDDLARIITRSAGILDIDIETSGATAIAGRSRGTPRIANRWLRRVRDWVSSEHVDGVVDGDVASSALDAFGVDRLGLDTGLRKLLTTVCVIYNGGPVGLGSLASSLGESTATIAEVYEPYLLHAGLLIRTSRGRAATQLAFDHLGVNAEDRAARLPGLD